MKKRELNKNKTSKNTLFLKPKMATIKHPQSQKNQKLKKSQKSLKPMKNLKIQNPNVKLKKLQPSKKNPKILAERHTNN